MNRHCFAILSACLSVPLAAQGSFVVPSKANTTQPGLTWFDSAPQSYPFWGSTSTTTASRVEYLYDVSDIPVPAALLLGMQVRPPVGYLMQAESFTTTIIGSVGPNPISAPSTVFASNHGANVATVFSGTLNLPAAANGPWPRPWQPIPFAQPLPFAAAMGPSLVLEFQTTASVNQRGWVVEGFREEAGNSGSELYQSNCRNSGNQTSGGWGWNSGGLVPGGSFTLNLSGYPINTPSLQSNALFFGLHGRGAQVGPFTTPFLLSSLGLPSGATCQWGIDILGGAGFPMTYRQYSTFAQLEMSNVPFPNSSSLAGVNFFTQNLALDIDPATNQPTLFPSIAIRWLIGTGNPVPVSRVLALGPTLASSGSVRVSEGAVVRFDY